MINTRKTHYETNELMQKHVSVKDYNENRSTVDRFDMQISSIECVGKTIKWYKSIFFPMLDIIVFNSYMGVANVMKFHFFPL